jgi:hypothetical protein
VLQLRNICDAVSLQLQHVEAVLRAKLGQALQRHDAVAGEHEQLQLQQRLKAVRVFQPVRAQVEVGQLRACVQVVDPLQRVAADVERGQAVEPAASPAEKE